MENDNVLGTIEVDSVQKEVHHNEIFAQASVKLAYAKTNVPAKHLMESEKEDRTEDITHGAIIEHESTPIVHQVIIHAHTSPQTVDDPLV